MDGMMLAWVFGVPVILLVMVLVLDRLESFVVAPIDRATVTHAIEALEVEEHLASALAMREDPA